jgi:dihydrodipicolinate synthase/N-acetylneuraminate lyase
MMKVMGMDIGDSRPPSEPLSEAEINELREMLIGFGFPVPEREAVLV